MEIVGDGFIARHLRPLAHRHPGAVVFAAGVSSAGSVSQEQFAREADLLYGTVRRCRADGRRLVYLSTCSAGMYGAPDCPGREDGPVYPRSAYARHKLALEGVLALSGVAHLILRTTHLVGPGQRPHQLLPSLVGQVRAGALEVHRGAYRDLLHIDDAVRFFDALLAATEPGRVVNVASGTAVPVEDIGAHLERALGVVARKTYRDAAGAYTVSVERLAALVPDVHRRVSAPGYYREVIDRYLRETQAAPADAGTERR
ncbi:nucleoside-diphosphate-sugar epimerase [Streptomyces olivoverticillatus]|uniref:Nucleoside-diphosphate-sugar epimerase n=1 Tax=Streptomyces olivoverticillatus TaxID=66427 RepID=A0A7W7LRR0_9ACTN|nr:NAD(P)-dependent oxidoreductase [Streptomyces olivoverticillatus]MBB4895208.1 nucleoside-diphosphate-sugar epimerase [Streptomyces olivoverticillatus]